MNGKARVSSAVRLLRARFEAGLTEDVASVARKFSAASSKLDH